MAALRVLFAAVLLVASFAALTVTPAEACTCGSGITEERVAAADLIVIGTTTEQRDGEPPPELVPTPVPPLELAPQVFFHRRIETQLRVDEYVKGSGSSELTLVSHGTVRYGQDGNVQISAGSDPTCGFVPEIDARYLFLLGEGDTDGYPISICDGHVPITAGDEAALARVDEVRQLAQQPQPAPNVDGLPDSGSDSDVILLFIAAAGVGAALLATGVFVIRRSVANDEN